jgi:methylmalonyl-CoA mutase
MKSSFYSDFETQSKEDWLKKIEFDLKGKSIEDLNKKLTENWEISPFHAREDLKSKPTPLQKYYDQCKIAASFDIAEDHIIDFMQDGLNNGLQSAIIENISSLDQLKPLLESTELGDLSLVLRFKNKADYNAIEQLVGGSNDIFIDYSYTSNKIEDHLASKVKSFPLKLKAIDAGEMPEEIANTLVHIVEALDECPSEKAADLLRSFWLEIDQGPIYYLEIARIRAFRILWANLIEDYGIKEDVSLPILTSVGQGVDQDDPYRNMIAYSTAGLYAIIGGADLLNIHKLGQKEGKPSIKTQRRVVRNIQNIAHLESHIGKVNDPAAGSYALENITTNLSKRSWQLFLQKTGSS